MNCFVVIEELVKFYPFLYAMRFGKTGEIYDGTFKSTKKLFKTFKTKDDAAKFMQERVLLWLKRRKEKRDKLDKQRVEKKKDVYDLINLKKVMKDPKALMRLLKEKIQ